MRRGKLHSSENLPYFMTYHDGDVVAVGERKGPVPGQQVGLAPQVDVLQCKNERLYYKVTHIIFATISTFC